MKAWHYMTQENVQDLADQALNEACRHIQDVIGVATGDLAGMFFTGENKDLIEEILRQYINLELQERSHEVEEFMGEINRAA
jgi:hypothetical protein